MNNESASHKIKRGRSSESVEEGQTAKKPSMMSSNPALGQSAPVKLHNRFAPLSNNGTSSNVQQNIQILKEKKVSIPPIIAKDLQFSDINVLLNKLNIKKYSIKIMSIGIKIQVNSMTEFDELNKQLISNKNKFFTYDSVKNSTAKFVLSGLPTLSLDEVKGAFLEQELAVIDVKAMNPKSSTFSNSALYLILVEKSKVDTLLKIKYLLHTVVKIRKFIQRHRGPIQCTKCHLHGHGERNCHLQPRCAKCGKDHSFDECQLVNPKCCNCNGDHLATSKECPSRSKFIAMKQKLSGKPIHRHQNHQKRPPVFTREEKDFPYFSKSTYNPTFNWGSTSHHQRPQPTNDDNNRLFNQDEIMNIITDVMSSMSSCKSQAEQLTEIFRLTCKYLNGST